MPVELDKFVYQRDGLPGQMNIYTQGVVSSPPSIASETRSYSSVPTVQRLATAGPLLSACLRQ
jgi:hypothetical protein